MVFIDSISSILFGKLSILLSKARHSILSAFEDQLFHTMQIETGHLMEPKAGWKRILERADIKDLRLHDLRRTLGSLGGQWYSILSSP